MDNNELAQGIKSDLQEIKLAFRDWLNQGNQLIQLIKKCCLNVKGQLALQKEDLKAKGGAFFDSNKQLIKTVVKTIDRPHRRRSRKVSVNNSS